MTEVAAGAADSGPLSFDAAVDMLAAPPEPENAAPQARDELTADQPAEESADDQFDAEVPSAEDAGEAEEPGDSEDEQEQEPAEPGVDAPAWWTAEDKAAFAKLPPEMQAIVARQEGIREQVVSKAKAEAAEMRKTAEGDVSRVKQASDVLAQWLPKAVETFKSRWEGIDWTRWAQQDPDAYTAGRAKFEEEQRILQGAAEAKQQADAIAYTEFVRTETEKLKTVCPDLADTKEGPGRQKALAEFLRGAGATDQDLRAMSADVAALAYDAMRWRQSQARLTGKAAPKPATNTPPVKVVAPVAAGRPASAKSREIEQASRRLSQTRSIDDAVALMLAKGM